MVWLIVMMGLVSGAELESGDRLYVNCNNATDGSLLGASGTIKCWDKAGNVDVTETGLTNVETGVFYYTFSETDDRYWCRINCSAGAVDYIIPVWQRTTPLVTTDNVGVNLDDVSGTLDIAETTGIADNTTLTAVKTKTDNLPADPADDSDIDSQLATIDSNLDAVLVDTNAQDTQAEWQALMGDVCYDTNLTQGIVVLTTATETQIDNIEADTNELQTNQNWDVWDDGTRTLTGFTASWVDSECTDATELNAVRDNIKSNTSAEADRVITQGDSAWATATGFSTHSAADVWASATRTLTAFTAAWIDAEAISEAELNAAHGTGYYNTSGSGTTPAAVWGYATRMITGGNLSTPNDYKADVSGLATSSQLNANTSVILSHGDTYWNSTSGSGLATQANITALQSHGDLYWNGTTTDISSLATSSQLNSNITTLISHGDTYWNSTSGSGLATQANITALQSHGDLYWNTSNHTSTAIADAIWDEMISGHTTNGSFGEIVQYIYNWLIYGGGRIV